MANEIVHETEIHRQHVRLRIPIAVEVDGARLTVDDWSLGGFGVLGDLPRRRPGDRFPVRLHLPFEDFELSLEVGCELVYRLEDGSRFGCRFTGLAPGQLALFRYLVDAYLSGELVAAGDVLAAHARAAAEIPSPGLVGEPGRGTLGARLRRALKFLLLLALGAGLGGLAWLGARERWLTVRAEAAIVEAPVVRLVAPATGRLRPGEPEPVLAVGGAIGTIETETGPTPLVSPCECSLVDWLAETGQQVEAGEAVALLAAIDRPLLVRASVAARAGRRLAAGDAALIELPGAHGSVRGRVERIDLRPQLLGLAGGDPVTAARRPLVVIVRPERPLDFELLGTPVEVRFH